MSRIPCRRTLSVALLLLLGTLAVATPRASAQWIVIELHPADAIESYAYGGDGVQQAGYVLQGGIARASLWSGTAASWVDLNPPGAIQSFINSANGGQQAGTVNIGGAIHATVWSGTAASRVDLHPAASPFDSQALGVNGGYQVGFASLNGALHASLWNGTAASWVDLYPLVGAWDDSRAWGVGDGQQVGWVAHTFDVLHASLWSGTAASWVDLSPAGSNESAALGVDGGQQAGYTLSSVGEHAALWSGTAASWVDLNPPGAVLSFAWGINHGQEVGAAFVGGVERASLWSGTPATWVDLHTFVPAKYSRSEAYGISHDGGFTYVTGAGFNAATQHWEALMWVGTSDPCLPRAWSGLLSPVQPDGTYKLGRTIPIKFALTGAGACSTDATLEAHLYVTKVSDGVVGTEVDAMSNSNADTGNRFRYADGQYIFNLGTSGLTKGTWRLRIDLGDGVEHTVLISLKP
jgi:hypothetical protein